MTKLFSFGYGHCAPNRWVRMESREAMVEAFSMYWYTEYDDTPKKIEDFGLYNMHEISLEDAEIAFIKWRTEKVTKMCIEQQYKIKYYDGESNDCSEEIDEAKGVIADCLVELGWLLERARKYNIEMPTIPDTIPTGEANEI